MKTCAITGEEFAITDKDLHLYQASRPVFGGKTVDIPTPTLSPQTRAQRRMAFRNERNLYKKKSFLTGKDIITMYHPDDSRKVCEAKLWHGDDWTAGDYARDFDFDRPFFEQFHELWQEVPMMALYMTGNCENCDYTNWYGGSFGAKNCYLCFNGGNCEDCMFCKGVIDSKNCLEMYL